MVTMTLIQGVMNTFVVFLSRVIGYVVDRIILRNDREGPGIGYIVTTIVMDLLLGVLAAISVAISGKSWWKGFTAELTIPNTSGRDLASWSTTFDTPHRITGTPWGVTLTSVDLGNGLTR
jgi:hypothetical protein